MRKLFLISSFIVVAVLNVTAQNVTLDQKKTIIKNVDKLLQNYIEYSKFDKPEYYKKFKNLFVSDISFVDEMNPEFYYTSDAAYPDQCSKHNLSDILKKTEQHYTKTGLNVKLKYSDVSYKLLNSGTVNLYIEKITEGISSDGLYFTSTAGIVLELKVTGAENTSVIINKLDYTFNNIKVTTEDKNKDFNNNLYIKALASAKKIRDEKEKARVKDSTDKANEFVRLENIRKEEARKKAEARAKFIKDSLQSRIEDSLQTVSQINKIQDLMKEPPHTWLTGGILLGTTTSKITNSNFLNNYLSHISTKSSFSDSKFKYLHTTGFNIMLHKYLGKGDTKSNFGFGVGLNYLQYKGTLSNDGLAVEYQAKDYNQAIYRQIIKSVGKLSENISMNSLSVPILVSLKGSIKGKLGYNIQAGLVYYLNFTSTSSNTSANFNREAVYNFTNNFDDKNNTAIYDNTEVGYMKSSWLITQDQVNKHFNGNNQLTETYFSNMQAQKFNVGLNETFKTSNTNTAFSSGAIGFVFNPSVTYEIQQANKNPLLLFLGMRYETTSFKTSNSDFRLVDEKLNYNALLGSASSVSIQSLNLSIGLSFPIGFNKNKWSSELNSLQTKQNNHQYGKY